MKNGYVELTLDRNGVQETWRRNGGSAVVTVSIASVPNEDISIDEAQQRFRARAFSQKQLSTLIRTSEEAYDRLKQVLNEAAIQVSSMSSGVLRAKVLQESMPRDIFSAFLSLCEQANVKDSHSRCTERADEVMTAGYEQSWDTLLQDAMDLLKMQVQTAPGSSAQIGEQKLYFVDIARAVAQRFRGYAEFLSCLGLAGPFEWSVGIDDVRNRMLQVPPPPNHISTSSGHRCMQDNLMAKGSYELGDVVPQTLKPFFNQLFRACGTSVPNHIDQIIQASGIR